MVLVPAQNIEPGTRLTESLLSQRPFPAQMLPEGVITPDDIADIINQPVSRKCYKGQALVWSDIGSIDAEETLSRTITPGERAITIPVNKISGLEGYIKPNDRIDLFASMAVPYVKDQQVPTQDGGVVSVKVEANKNVVFLLLQNVVVLATGQSFNQNVAQNSYASLTLALTPKEAGLVKFAMDHGSLSAILRNSKDFGEDAEIEFIDIDEFMNLSKLKDLQNERTKRVEVYKMGKAKIIEKENSL